MPALSPLLSRTLASPVGPLHLAASDDGVVLCEFDNPLRLARESAEIESHFGAAPIESTPIAAALDADAAHTHLDSLARELDLYFARKLHAFTTPLAPFGTPFERAVWDELLKIPFGVTCSYEDIARRLSKPNAQRAVGRANGRNRIAILIPCHRVIEKSGALRGYAGGLERKRWLLEHEGALGGSLFA